MTYTAEDVQRTYQIGYEHHSDGRPPLDNDQVLRAVEVMRSAIKETPNE